MVQLISVVLNHLEQCLPPGTFGWGFCCITSSLCNFSYNMRTKILKNTLFLNVILLACGHCMSRL